MKKAFTLVEMLIVIAIIGLLMSALVVHLRGGSESANAAKCQSNMRNIAAAVTVYMQNHQHYPLAGSVEKFDIDDSNGRRNAREVYSEQTGWLSWDSQGRYASKPQAHISSAGWFTSAYNQNDLCRWYSITNGAIWGYMNGAAECYACPSHLKKMKSKQKPFFSYVMNSYFGFDSSNGSDSVPVQYYGVRGDAVARKDKILLLAELQWEGYTGKTPNYSESSGPENDCTLQYQSSDGGETIGFNHKTGRDVVAHVIYADNHPEKIVYPSSGMSDAQLHDLTEWLCEGTDFSFDGKRYSEVK